MCDLLPDYSDFPHDPVENEVLTGVLCHELYYNQNKSLPEEFLSDNLNRERTAPF